MPIIIDEVAITVEVTNRDSGGVASATSATDDKQAIITECVERVLEITRCFGVDLYDKDGPIGYQ